MALNHKQSLVASVDSEDCPQILIWNVFSLEILYKIKLTQNYEIYDMNFLFDLDILVLIGLKNQSPLKAFNYKTGECILTMFMDNFIKRIVPIKINVSEEIYQTRISP